MIGSSFHAVPSPYGSSPYGSSFQDHLECLVDPTGKGQITSMLSMDLPVKYTKKPIPVTIKNIRYRSITSAAMSLGVAPSTIKNAMRKDTLDDIVKPHYWEVMGLDFNTLSDAAGYFCSTIYQVRKEAIKILK